MLTYKNDTPERIAVFGWDDFSCEDNVLICYLERCVDGYWWLSDDVETPMSCKMLRDVAEKLSELNT